MKRFSVIALAVGHCVVAQATILAYTPNVIGGYTMLTDEYCTTNDDYLQAYASNSNHEVIKACWYIKEDFVYESDVLKAVYKNGDLDIDTELDFNLAQIVAN